MKVKMVIYDCKITNISIKRAYLEALHDSNLGNYIEYRPPQVKQRIFNVKNSMLQLHVCLWARR